MKKINSVFIISLILWNIVKNDAADDAAKSDSSDKITFALLGYNIMEGDPTSIYDPGFKHKIFEESEYGITCSQFRNCEGFLNEKSFTTMESYRNALTELSSSGRDLQIGWENKLSLSLNAEPVPKVTAGATSEVVIPPAFTRAWSSSNDMVNALNWFTNRKGMISIASAKCLIYDIGVNTNYRSPNFTKPFISALQTLHLASNDVKIQVDAFKNFIKEFGTHYQSRTKLGAQIIYRRKYSSNVRQKNTAIKLDNCNKIEGSKVFNVQVERSSSLCSSEDNKSIKEYGQEDLIESFTTKGSSPEKSIHEWAKQKFTPVPILFELSLIINLFKEELIENKKLALINNEKINSKEITRWFAPLYFDYCKTMGIECVEKTSGCGINDKCTIDEICIEKTKSKQLCLSTYTCRQMVTELFDITSSKAANLDKFTLMCGENEAIKSFKLEIAGKKHHYLYKCCSIQLPRDEEYVVQNPYIDYNNKNNENLEKQNINCSSSYINIFGISISGNKLRYDYSCYHVYEEKKCYNRNTQKTNAEDNLYSQIGALDKIPVTCKDLETLSSFQLQKENSKIWYSYTCCQTSPTVNEPSYIFCKPTYTPFSDHMHGKIQSLTKHNLKCELGFALTSFQTQEDGENKIRYAGKCCRLPGSLKKYTQKDVVNDRTDDDDQVVSLDKQTIKCEGGFIQSFKLERFDKKLGYSYVCQIRNKERKIDKTCTIHYTTYQLSNQVYKYYKNKGDTRYLDRIRDIECEDNYFLSAFKLHRKKDEDQYWRYNYLCCKFKK